MMAIINLGLSIILCQKYGAIGSAIGTAISLVVANGFIMNIYYNSHCNIDVPLFWKNILRQSMGLIVPIVSGFILTKQVVVDSNMKFVFLIIFYSIVYCISMWFLGMNNYERDLIRLPLRKFFRRKST